MFFKVLSNEGYVSVKINITSKMTTSKSCPLKNKSKKNAVKELSPVKTDFSIEHILNYAGSTTTSANATAAKFSNATSSNDARNEHDLFAFSWLNCTRYCPPKLPRSHKKEGPQKRQLGRHPRIPFSSQQLSVLEEKFKQTPYLSGSEVTQLSSFLHLADIRVKIWFQNRRARERREKIELETQPRIKSERETETKEIEELQLSNRNAAIHSQGYLSPTFSNDYSISSYPNLNTFFFHS